MAPTRAWLERHDAGCENGLDGLDEGVALSSKITRTLTEGQRAYEAKRAAKAGMSLERWLDSKQRQQESEARARQKAAEPPKVKKNTLFSRLMERAQKPL